MRLLKELLTLRKTTDILRYVTLKNVVTGELRYVIATTSPVEPAAVNELEQLPAVKSGLLPLADAQRQLLVGMDTASLQWEMDGYIRLGPSPRDIGVARQKLDEQPEKVRALGAQLKGLTDRGINNKWATVAEFAQYVKAAGAVCMMAGFNGYPALRNPKLALNTDWLNENNSTTENKGWQVGSVGNLPPGFVLLSGISHTGNTEVQGTIMEPSFALLYLGRRAGIAGKLNATTTPANGALLSTSTSSWVSNRGVFDYKEAWGINWGGRPASTAIVRTQGIGNDYRPPVNDYPSVTLFIWVHGVLTIPDTEWYVEAISTVAPGADVGHLSRRKTIPVSGKDVILTVPAYTLAAAAQAWARRDAPDSGKIQDQVLAAESFAKQGVMARGQYGNKLVTFKRLQDWHGDWDDLEDKDEMLPKARDFDRMTVGDINSKYKGFQFANLLAWIPFAGGAQPGIIAVQSGLSDYNLYRIADKAELKLADVTDEAAVRAWMGDTTISCPPVFYDGLCTYFGNREWRSLILEIDKIEDEAVQGDDKLCPPSIATAGDRRVAEAFVALKVRENKEMLQMVLIVRDVEQATLV